MSRCCDIGAAVAFPGHYRAGSRAAARKMAKSQQRHRAGPAAARPSLSPSTPALQKNNAVNILNNGLRPGFPLILESAHNAEGWHARAKCKNAAAITSRRRHSRALPYHFMRDDDRCQHRGIISPPRMPRPRRAAARLYYAIHFARYWYRHTQFNAVASRAIVTWSTASRHGTAIRPFLSLFQMRIRHVGARRSLHGNEEYAHAIVVITFFL